MRTFRQAHAATEPPATRPSIAPVVNMAVVTADAIKMPMDNPLCMSSETPGLTIPIDPDPVRQDKHGTPLR